MGAISSFGFIKRAYLALNTLQGAEYADQQAAEELARGGLGLSNLDNLNHYQRYAEEAREEGRRLREEAAELLGGLSIEEARKLVEESGLSSIQQGMRSMSGPPEALALFCRLFYEPQADAGLVGLVEAWSVGRNASHSFYLGIDAAGRFHASSSGEDEASSWRLCREVSPGVVDTGYIGH